MNIIKKIIDWILSKFMKRNPVYLDVGKDFKVDITSIVNKADKAILNSITKDENQKFAYLLLNGNDCKEEKITEFTNKMSDLGIKVDNKPCVSNGKESNLLTLSWDKLDKIKDINDKIKR